MLSRLFPGNAAVPAAPACEDAGAPRNCLSPIFVALFLTLTSDCTPSREIPQRSRSAAAARINLRAGVSPRLHSISPTVGASVCALHVPLTSANIAANNATILLMRSVLPVPSMCLGDPYSYSALSVAENDGAGRPDGAANQRSDDWDKSIPPIRVALPGNR